MNRAEVMEIRKQYKITDCSVKRICGWYVDAEHELVTSFNEFFLTKPEEEQHKYLNIFKKGLSGTGKQLSTLKFNDSEVRKVLTSAVGSRLEESNQPFLDALYEEVVKHLNVVENVLILLMCNSYDIPNRNEDKLKDGESDEVYSYISLYICPMPLEKSGLAYSHSKNAIVNKEMRRIVTDPEFAFIYPSFEDRSADFDKITVFVKSDKYANLITDFLGCDDTLTAADQTKIMNDIVSCAIENSDNQDKIAVVKQITKALDAEAKKLEESPSSEVSVNKVKEILKTSVSSDVVDTAIKQNKADVKEPVFKADAIRPASMAIKSDGIDLKVKAEETSRIERRVIDGKEYILIEVDGKPLTVNGIVINE